MTPVHELIPNEGGRRRRRRRRMTLGTYQSILNLMFR